MNKISGSYRGLVQSMASRLGFPYTRMCGLLALFLLLPVLQAAPTLTVSKTIAAGATTVAAGTPFSYVINWANPSTTQDAHGAILTDVLPTQLSWAASDVSFSSSATYVSSAVYNPTTGTMTWTFVDPLPAGTSGQFTLTSLFPNGTTPNGTVAVNTASLSQTGGSTATSSPATITATASSQVSVTKTLTAGGAAGEDTTYTVAATNSTAAGGLNLNGAVLTDYLPTNAVFISATDSATYNSTFNTVTWPSTTLAIGTGVSHQITVLYPSPTFGVSQTVTNNVTLVGTPVGASSPVTNKTSQVATLSNPTAYLSAVKTLNSGGAAGDETTYTVSASNSSSSDTLMTNVVMIDSLPTGAVFISATESGTYNSSANTVIWTNSSLAIGSTTNHSVTVLYPTPTFQSGNKVTNNLTVIGTPYGGNSYVTNTASLATTLSNPTSFFTVSKTLTSGGAVNQNTTYTVTASNSSSSDTILTNVVLIDTLPVSANFISATGGGTYSGNTVTWPATNIAIGGSASYTVTVLYATNAVASSVTNLLTGIAYPPGPSLPITNSTSLKTTLANASSFLTTSKSFNSGGAVGEQTKYTVSAKNSSSSGLTMTNVVLVDFLPTNVFFVSATGSGAYNSTSNTVTWPAATITPGSTDSQTVIITYPPSNYSSGSVATNNLNVVAYLPGGYSVTNTASVTTTLTGSSTLYTVSKTLRSGGAVGNNTEYAVTMNNPSSSGVTLTNVVMTDTLPTGASFVSATGSGVYNSSLGTVTWPAASVSANSSTTQYVIVNYPTNLFTSGQKITNVLSVIATPPGLTPVSASATNVATLTAPTDSVGFSKTASATVATIGSTSINYTLNITNTGNTVLTNYQVVDIIPAGVTVTDVQIDPVNAYEAEQGAGTVTLEYSTSAATPYTWTTVTGTPGTSFVRKNSSLPAITAVRWTFSSVPPGFTSKSFASGTGSGLSATFSSAIADGTTVANCASYTYSTTYGTPTQKSGSSCVNVLAVNGQTAALVATKAAATGVNPGSAITYTVGVAAGNSLATVANPVIADLVPSGLTYVSGSWAVVSGPTPVLFENIPNYNGTSQTLLRWTYSAAVGTNGAKVSFQATVPSGITYGASYTNTSYVVNWANSAVSGNTTTDINDLNGNGSTSDTIAASTPVVVKVNRAATLNSLKYVIGQLDVNYSRYPTNGNSVPGGVANYKLTVQNSGDVSLTNILIIDILPFVGDTGVVDLSPRNTAWRPNLASTVTAPSGVTVYYSTASNPSRPEMGVTTSYPANWSTVPPSDLTTVQSLKFDFGTTVLGPQDQLELDWAMRVPVDAPTDGSIAWNSFGVVGTPIDTLTPFNATEPIKVGIAAEPIKPAAWGDFVWNDANHNGIQDTGEVGIDSVRVELYNHTGSQTNADPTLDTYIGFTVTSGGGKYLFSSLAPGNYYAVFFTPPTYLVSPARQGTDSTKDSDGTATTVHGFPATITPIFTLNSGDVTLNEDQGFYQPTVPINSVGDYVWNDLNADGIQNEPAANGLNGIGVQIYTGAGVLVSSTTTANDLNGNPGYYQFNGLTNGSYYVQFSLPSADSFTTANAVGSTTNTDSDVVVVGSNYGKTATFTLSGGQYDSSRDAGLLLPTGPMSLGDFVWLDTNGNGLEDDGQTGINGVKVNLYKDSDNNGVYTPGTDQFIATTTTYTVGGNPGFYSFTSLPVGKYIVQIDPSNFGAGGTLNGLVPSGPQPPPTPNSDTTNDNKGYLLTTNGVVTAVVTLTLNGEPGPNGSNNNGTIDFGFNQYVTIGDFVWVDTNGNGVQDAGEPGISGVTLTLAGTSAGGASITSHTTTDANGHYSFSEPPGTYTVTVDSSNSTNALAGYSLTASGQGTTSTDSNPNPSGTTPVALNSGTSDSTIDFGYYKPVTIGDFVWLDTNGNGIQDNGELGIAGVTLTLSGTNAAGASVTDQAATDSNGHYSFSEAPGTYTVTVDSSNSTGALAGYSATATGKGTTANDSNVNPSGTTPAILLSGASDSTVDFGYYKPVTIGDFVWADTNGNGLQDNGEPGISGVTLTLTGTSDAGTNITAHATTDSNGAYSFTEPPGTYTVTVDASNSTGALAGYSATATGKGTLANDSNVNPSGTTPAILLSGASDSTVDFGYYKPVTIGDFVWADTNGNGVQDNGEPGISGVTLTLTGTSDAGTSITAHATTDGNGAYSFTEPPGTYTVTVDASNSTGALAGYSATATGKGTVANDSNVNPSGTTPAILVSGASDNTIDFGYYKPVTIGDFVWADTNGNGVQDNGEPGIAGVTLTLTGTSDAGTSITAHATTDSNGAYSFTEPPGTYTVTVDASNSTGALAGYSATATGKGTLANDSNVNPSGTTPAILLSGASDSTVDFGYYKPVTIGDFVWADTNGNGVQDNGEPGIAGVTLTLTGTSDAGTNITAHATTDGNGAYSFTEPPGTYTVTVDASNSTGALAGYSATATGKGTLANDSNVNPSGTTPAILLSGASDSTVDFGYYKPVTIGDFVWADTNGNGVQDNGEPGISGVTLTLAGTSDAGTNITAHATTDGNGAYSFTEPPGTYTVTVDASNSTGALAGYSATATGKGTVANDSNVNPSGTTPAILLSGASDSTVDFGYFKPVTIGDFVWADANGNGVQDNGEPGISGVTLTLTGTSDAGTNITAHATTDSNGAYSFTEPPGTYTVTVDASNSTGALAGYSATATGKGTPGTDSNVNPSGTSPATLNSGASDNTVDFGYYKPVKIGDFVWLDTNGNGVQDNGELGIAGVLLTLTGTNAVGLAVTNYVTTDTNGYYSFSAAPGTYLVTVDATNSVGTNVLAGYQLTATGLGTTATDSNPNPSGTTPIVLTSGTSDVTIDFGYFKPVTIGHFVWVDTNGNGVQDDGEPGIPGVTLTLTGTSDAGTNITAHATTDSNGAYSFTEPPGTYTVTVDASNSTGALAGYTATVTGQGTTSTDSNVNPSGTTPATLLSGASDTTIDFGYYKSVTIGHFVWVDTNGNGVQDGGEPGIPGVTLTLTGTTDSGSTLTDNATTDANGYYSFTEPPGTYTVTVDASNSTGVLAGYTATVTGQGTTSTDSNLNPSGTTPATLLSGASDTTIDFGYFRPVTIGDFVWTDTNGNGVQDGGEPGIPGVTLTLTGTTDVGVAITNHATTDVNGHYSFSEPPGTYTVTVDASNSTGALAGYTATVTGQGSTSTDSNANPSGTTPTTLFSGSSDTTVDFGYYKPVKIGDFVWLDTNGNGIQEAGEPGIAGVILTLTGTNTAGLAITNQVTTDTNGYYSFSAAPGTYLVTVDATNLVGTNVLAGYELTAIGQGTPATDSNPNPSGTTPIVLTSGTSDVTIDFGYFKPVTIGHFVWVDTNGNGVQDIGEPGIPGVTLTLTGTSDAGTNITAHATTDSNGTYSFSEPPGTYTVTVDSNNSTGALAGYTATATGQGTTSTDSNVNPSGTTPATLDSGASDNTVDFGYYKPVTIGDFVWVDTNGNGIQDGGEPGIPGVTLTLTGTTDAGVAISDQTTTDINGAYSFSEPPGTYTVTVDSNNSTGALAGYIATAINQGTVATDSNVTPSGTTPATLLSGAFDNTIDFGYYKPVTIGDFVWVDTNGNGIQDGGEPGIPGVTLTLTGTTDTGAIVTAHATTDGNGHYSFSEPPGTYTVTVDSTNAAGALAGYTATATNQGTAATDSNVNPSSTTPATLLSGSSDTTVDFGYYKPVKIGDFVWLDTNGNGIQEAGEPGIAGVILTLSGTNAAGYAVTNQVTTDSNGYYLFSEAPGTYQVSVDATNMVGTNVLAGYAPTAIGLGTTDTDSNSNPSPTSPSTLNSGMSDSSIDFGYYIPVTIGHFVWLDSNRDGVQEPGEPGISGVALTLTGTSTAGTNITDHATTDAQGNYKFQEPPGTYTVSIDAANDNGALSGYVPTITGQGTVSTDSNEDPSATTPALLLSGASDSTIDFGYIVAPPTAATLSYFSAQRHGNNQTLLTWRALVDVNVIGFLVDRQGPAGWVRITPHILPVIGDGRRPEVYNFSDVGGAKAYRLLTVDPQGGIQVVATVVPGVSAQSWISQDGKAINVQLVGTSNATVSVQTTTDLNGGNWTEAGTVTLDAQGNAQFSDAFDSTASKLFYRFSEK